MKRLFNLILCAALLAGCAGTSLPTDSAGENVQQIQYDWMAGESPVPNIRTGIDQQGTDVVENSFEVTDTGVYWLFDDGYGESVMYCDHDSKNAIKLCSRPDCMHKDETCDSCFRHGANICYYNGHLYITTAYGAAISLYQIDPDGRNRVKVMDNTSVIDGYRGSDSVEIRNGVLFFNLFKLDDAGNETSVLFYYKLDGSMKEPLQAPQEAEGLRLYWNDGVNTLLTGSERFEADTMYCSLYSWDIESGTITYLAEIPGTWMGYYGVEAGYYMNGGKVCRLNYEDGSEEVLFDTGSEGTYRLHAFPDHFIVSQDIRWMPSIQGKVLNSQTLRFYSWDYEYLGEVEIPYPVYNSTTYEDIICGDTENRIYLAAHLMGAPEYYIEKSDFGSGKIQIHKLDLPENVKAVLEEIESGGRTIHYD